jgi:hypothetical protein
VLVEKCSGCHSTRGGKTKGGLSLDTPESVLKGGNSGPAVVPGKPDESPVFLAISRTGEFAPMPPKETLAEPVVTAFRQWITHGAPVPPPAAKPRGEPTSDWWSLRPIARPPVPSLSPEDAAWARTPIDAFIVSKLRENGLRPSPEADRRTLIRRLFFDFLGLPPSLEETSAFLADTRPDAYERLVDRLLASPHYGERWARHWMDLVHFAETHGHDQDRIRPNAWPYRDYLIEAFNDDRPYARFIQEQVAADVLFPGEPQRVVALGMIAAGPWDESSLRDIREDSIDRQIGRYIDRDDMVSTVMSTFVSMTVHCARCHDHKFDPISQDDYYGLQAVFAGVDRADRAFDPDPAIGLVRAAIGVQERIVPQQRLSWSIVRAALPAPRLVYAAASAFAPDGSHRPPPGPRAVHVLKRGDIHKADKLAVAGALTCLPSLPGRFSIAHPQREGLRRAALARWLSDPHNPLTYRSIVNRVWQQHFGRGIVDTPSDFGRMGSLPSHPELLDWLAARFVAEGGSLKKLHRLIVTSRVYRQAVRHDPVAAERDADNRLLWRMNRRRLDAESVHDAILAAAGRLDPTMGGPSVRQFALKPGVHVTPVVDYAAYDWNAPGSGRRSIYRFLFRTLPDPFMESLDEADGSQLTPSRSESVTPLQALVLLNDPFVAHESEHMAQGLEREQPEAAAQIRRACELVLNRPPDVEELARLEAFARHHGLPSACRILFNSNEFLFVN